MDTQSQKSWQAEAERAWHSPGHTSLTKGPKLLDIKPKTALHVSLQKLKQTQVFNKPNPNHIWANPGAQKPSYKDRNTSCVPNPIGLHHRINLGNREQVGDAHPTPVAWTRSASEGC